MCGPRYGRVIDRYIHTGPTDFQSLWLTDLVEKVSGYALRLDHARNEGDHPSTFSHRCHQSATGECGVYQVTKAPKLVDIESSADEVSRSHHYDVFLGQYSFMGTKADEFDEAMRYDLQRNTPKVLASFVAEVDYVFEKTFGKPRVWEAFQPRECMARVAALMSGRAFVGLPLSRDEEWAEATVTYTQDVTKAWMVLRMIPKSLHWLLAPCLPQVRSLNQHKALTQRKLKPLLRQELSADKQNGQVGDGEPGGDMIRWFRKRYTSPATAENLTRDQLLATFASIYNLTNALSYLLFDLATYQEHIEPLRAELKEQVGTEGRITKENIQKLRKLDSFIRESQRLSPPSLGMRSPTRHSLIEKATLTLRQQTCLVL